MNQKRRKKWVEIRANIQCQLFIHEIFQYSALWTHLSGYHKIIEVQEPSTQPCGWMDLGLVVWVKRHWSCCVLELLSVCETETKTDRKPDRKKQGQCVLVYIYIYMGVHMSGVVCVGKYLNIMEDFVVCLCIESLYICVCFWLCVCMHLCTGHWWEEQCTLKILKRCVPCWTYTYLSPWRYARACTHKHTHTHTLMHNKHTYTAPGERVCDLEGDNSVARPHRRQLSTE